MKKTFFTVLTFVFLSFYALGGASAQDKPKLIDLSYWDGAKMYMRISGKKFTDADLREYLEKFNAKEYREKWGNEFQWGPWLKKMRGEIEAEIAKINPETTYYGVTFSARVSDYDFDKNGFYAVISSGDLFRFTGSGSIIIFGPDSYDYHKDPDPGNNLIIVPIPFYNKYFFPMAPDKAEQFVKAISGNHRYCDVKIFFKITDKTNAVLQDVNKQNAPYEKDLNADYVLPMEAVGAVIIYEDAARKRQAIDVTSFLLQK